jgi:hypothetical protein
MSRDGVMSKDRVGRGAFARSAERSQAATTTNSLESVAVHGSSILLK